MRGLGRLNPWLGLLIAGTFVAGFWLLRYLVVQLTWSPSLAINMGLFAALVMMAGLFPLPVGPRVKAGVTTAPLFLAAVVLPPGAAVVAAVLGGVGYNVVLRIRKPTLLLSWYKYIFNTGETALSTGVASWLFQQLGGNLTSPAVIVPVVAMYMMNTGLISLAAASQLRSSPAKFWWQGTKENGLAEVSLYSFGYLGAITYQRDPRILVALLIPVVIIYFAFSRLAHANGRLEDALSKVKNLQGELLQNAKLATVGALTLDLGHQVKNPLFITIGRLETLQRRIPVGDPNRSKVDEALQSAWRVNELTDAFLSVARQQWAKLDLVLVLEEAVGMSTTSINKAVNVGRAFAVESLATRGHPILLREAISNLVNNAIEAVPIGGEVSVGLEASNGHATITITDNGPGISQAQMSKLFEPFNTSKQKGMGLGLFSAKHIVEMHHGTIQVESHTGQGTRIQLVLPVVKPEEESGEGPDPASAQPSLAER